MSKLGDWLSGVSGGKQDETMDSINDSKEAIQRLEIMTEELIESDKSRKSYETLISIATDYLDSPIWGKDVNGKFVFMNVACAEKILKSNMEDAMKEPDEGYVPNQLEMVCCDSDKLVQETNRTHRFFEHAVFDDGSEVWLDTTKSPWFVGGELVGTVGMGHDITEAVPKDVRDEYCDAGSVEIDVDLMYNISDIRELVSVD